MYLASSASGTSLQHAAPQEGRASAMSSGRHSIVGRFASASG